MKRWMRFFVGSPRRFLVTAAVVVTGAAFTHYYPGRLFAALQQLISEMSPLLVFLVVLFTIRRILFGK